MLFLVGLMIRTAHATGRVHSGSLRSYPCLMGVPNTSSSNDARPIDRPTTAAIIIPHHSSRLAANPLVIVHSAGVGRGGSGAGGARS